MELGFDWMLRISSYDLTIVLFCFVSFCFVHVALVMSEEVTLMKDNKNKLMKYAQ